MLEKCQDCKANDPRFILASDTLFAIEANIPEEEIPDWPGKTLKQLVLLMAQLSVTDNGSTVATNQNFVALTTITFKPCDSFYHLSKTTMQKCFQSLSLQVCQTLPPMMGHAGQHYWPKLLSSFKE